MDKNAGGKDPPTLKSSASVTEQILDYFNKFGQERDLQKYLRLRKHYNKSSSDGSISALSAEQLRKSSQNNEAKSLDQLNSVTTATGGTILTSKTLGNQPFSRNSSSSSSSNQKKSIQSTRPTTVTNFDTKLEKNLNTDASRKLSSENFHTGSNISLIVSLFPGTVSAPELSAKFGDSSLTDVDESLDNALKGNKEADGNKGFSKRLEWDSLGDVGYGEGNKLSKKQSKSMSTLERSILREFFAEQGIELHFPSEKQNPSIDQNELRNIVNEKEISESEPYEKWRQTLQHMKKKYFADEGKSEIVNPSSTASTSIANQFAKSYSTPAVHNNEKYCQTSFINTQGPKIQVDMRKSGLNKTPLDTGSITAPSSFEYIPCKRRTKRNLPEKENLSPFSTSTPTTVTTETTTKSTMSSAEINRSICSYRRKRSGGSSLTDQSFSTDLDLGVKLLCSLIESKSLSDKEKKNLAKKIISRITRKGNASSSTCTRNECTTSTVTTHSSDVISKVSLKRSVKNAKLQNENDSENSGSPQKTVDSSSVLSSEMNSLAPKTENVNTVRENLAAQRKVPSLVIENDTNNEKFVKKTNTVENRQYYEEKDWLKPITKSEIQKLKQIRMASGSKDKKSSTSSKKILYQFMEEEKKTHLKWIENEIKRLENLKHFLVINESNEDSSNLQSTGTLTYSEMENSHNKYASIDGGRSKFNRNPDLCMKKNRKSLKSLKLIENKSNENEFIGVVAKHCHRSKLDTPKSSEACSVKSFAISCRDEPLEVEKQKSDSHEYDQPATTSINFPEKQSKRSVLRKSDAYTSVSSSDFFISSESISIPVPPASSSSTTTTTHQYDSPLAAAAVAGVHEFADIGIQTSDSVLRTKPIFYAKCKCKNNPCVCPYLTTQRTYKTELIDKQIQTAPKSIAYSIQFYTMENSSAKKSKSSRKSSTSSSPTATATEESLKLSEYLEKNNPKFCSNANHRQNMIETIKRLREERNNKIRDIFENANDMESIAKKFKELPPPPTRCVKIFPTKEIKRNTRKKYSRLPEVVAKKQKEKENRYHQSNKILQKIFNKKLQSRVLQGKLSLNHSQTII